MRFWNSRSLLRVLLLAMLTVSACSGNGASVTDSNTRSTTEPETDVLDADVTAGSSRSSDSTTVTTEYEIGPDPFAGMWDFNPSEGFSMSGSLVCCGSTRRAFT